MPKYIIETSKIVFHKTEVDAKSKKDATKKLIDGEVELGDVVDSSDFTVEWIGTVEEYDNRIQKMFDGF